jgi:GT2 family glycosyltransferase
LPLLDKDLPLVSIIAVSLNGKKWLEGLFSSIKATDYPEAKLEYIFVDNGSTDGSVEFVKNMFPSDSRLRIIQNKTNMGWSPANNQGMKIAKGEIIVCISNDMMVDKSWIREIVNVMQSNAQIGMVQCNSLSMWDRKTPDSGMNYLDKLGYSYSYAATNRKYEVFFAEGMAFAIKKEVIRKVGVFDDYFFMEYDDMDLSWRVRLGGYKIFYAPAAKVYHARGGTVGATYFQRVNNITWYTRNHLATIIKNYELKTLFALMPPILAVEMIKIVYLATVKKNLKLARAAFRGLYEAARDLRVILGKRMEVQNFRTIPDSEIFKVMHPFNPFLLRLFLVKQSRSERLVLHTAPPINLRNTFLCDKLR